MISHNVKRRHMSKGLLAMALAKIYPEAAKGGRGKKASLNEGFGGAYLYQARTVLKHTPDAAEKTFTEGIGTRCSDGRAQHFNPSANRYPLEA